MTSLIPSVSPITVPITIPIALAVISPTVPIPVSLATRTPTSMSLPIPLFLLSLWSSSVPLVPWPLFIETPLFSLLSITRLIPVPSERTAPLPSVLLTISPVLPLSLSALVAWDDSHRIVDIVIGTVFSLMWTSAVPASCFCRSHRPRSTHGLFCCVTPSS